MLIPEENSREDEERLREMTAGIIFGWGEGYYGGVSREMKIQYTFGQLRDCLDVEPGQKRYVSCSRKKSVGVCVFS